MNGLRLSLVALCIMLCCSFKTNRADQMAADLEFIASTFAVHYAPAQWKKQYVNWDLAVEVERARLRIFSNPSLNVKEYQKIIRDFFRSARDYHMNVRFHSTESASLPFNVIGANERYYIVHVNPLMLSPTNFTIREGDELVTFGGRPVHQVILELQASEFGSADPGTDRALTEILLTRRTGSTGSDVPRGPIEIGIRRKNKTEVKHFQLIWGYTPEQITHSFEPEALSIKYELSMLAPVFADHTEHDLNQHALGSKRGFLPPLGKILWKAEDTGPFYAYLWETEDGHRIGYIRIPHYVGDELYAEEFKEIIRRFEETSEALVVDQLNNPGGSVFYLYALASMLADKPLVTPKHRLTITPREVEFAVKSIPVLQGIHNDKEAQERLGDTLSGYPVTYQTAQFILEFCRFTITEWKAGRTFTDPTHLYGVDHINPHPDASYTKPVLVLINHLDFSGGDFFPAILQDNKRATLLGTKTAGAGGFVARMSFPNRFGIDNFYYTASIAERIDKQPIENLGVVPDIEYTLTAHDFQNHYQGFSSAIRASVLNILE